MSIFRVKILVFFIALAMPGQALSDSNQFFEPNVSRHIFSKEAVLQPSENFQHFRKTNIGPAEKVAEEETQEALPEPEMTPEDELRAEFGDPSEVHPVLAKNDAPKPFRAMMAAMNKGEDKLAYDYAKQYVRYVQDLNRSNMRAVGLSQLAMVREGLISEGDVINSVNPEDRKLLDQDIKEHLDAEKSKSYLGNLDPATRALLLKAKGDVIKEDVVEDEFAEEIEDELAEEERVQRFKAKLELNKKFIPVDPEGKVDVIFFFEPEQINSIKMAPAIEAVFRESLEDENLNLIAFTLSPMDRDRELKFKRITHANFPIKSASEAARAMGVTQAPATVVISQSTGESVVEVGNRSFFYLDELIQKMQGIVQGGEQDE